MTTNQDPTVEERWYALAAPDVVARVGVDPATGLDADEVQRRLAEFGRNEIATRAAADAVGGGQGSAANPMNIMLLIVSVASFAIGQVATGAIVLALVSFNVIMGTSQERKAMASVEALAQLQVPKARVRRSGSVEEVDSTGLVPGDIVLDRGRRPRPGRCPRRHLGILGGPGGLADRGERADRQGRRDAPGAGHGARRPHEPRLPEHPGHPGLGDGRRGGHRARRRRWATSPTWSRRRSARSRRCSASSTA